MRSTQNDRQPALKGGRFSMKQKFVVSFKLSHVHANVQSLAGDQLIPTRIWQLQTMQYVVRLTQENKATGTNWL